MKTEWSGNEVVEHGKWTGEKWSNLHRNTLEWYRDNLDDGPLKSCALIEIERRDKKGEF